MIKYSCYVLVLGSLVACSSESNPSIASYPDQGTPVFQTYAKQCSSCHRPPMPDVHAAKDWPMVVARMQQHKEQRGLLRMRDQDKQEVLAYLQAHAKKEVVK